MSSPTTSAASDASATSSGAAASSASAVPSGTSTGTGLPITDVRTELLTPSDTVTHSPSRGDASHFTVTTTRARAVDAAWQYTDSPIEVLRDHIRFDFGAMQWFEEDEEITIHPRDPGTRKRRPW